MGKLFRWAIVFLIVAVIAAVLGFTNLAGAAMGGAKLLFWAALVLFIISLVGGFVGRDRP